MSDPVTISIIVAIQAVILALIARTNHNVGKIEKATNSMKDRLILSTEKEALSRGHAAGVKAEQDKEMATKHRKTPHE